MTAPAPRLIVIDEPNSFLHPGAAKKLLSILRQLPHQYVISTHSADIIRTVDPEFLHLIEWNGEEAAFQTLNRANITDQRKVLSELGVNLSDVFGAENVLWVEGPTEESCFPRLLDHLGLLSPTTVVKALVATGDLEGWRVRAALVWELYERLSAGTALVPPALAFSLDREGRTPAELDDLQRRSRGMLRFLPRRTYENYLLEPNAIAAILAKEVKNSAKPTPGSIADWVRAQRGAGRYLAASVEAEATHELWAAAVDAPKMLKDLFWEMGTLEYSKTAHSWALTTWLLEHNPAYMQELLDYVSTLVRQRPTVSPRS